MKNPERVAALLAELRELADNDFERHRIDVLEQDLTAPPVVEQVDDTHQRFNGIIYRKDNSRHYSANQQIHRAVYRYYQGEIPTGYEIHHRDENPANNAPDNLQCLTKSSHSALHHRDGVGKKTKNFICAQCGKPLTIRATANRRFCSQTCYIKYCNEKKKRPSVCAFCGKIFIAHDKRQKFCSQSCNAKFQFKDHRETRTCPICGKTFTARISTNKRACSQACAAVLRWQTRKANQGSASPDSAKC